jgi:hypothetical protein
VIDAVVNFFPVDFVYVYILYGVVGVVDVYVCIVWSDLFFALTDLLYKQCVLYHTYHTLSTIFNCQHLF